ncbi:uncharacterized protein PAC_00342 [Phialocephala subalpina]|uniref:Uncharacterized protein n=1 Tax=Phialocephala subalpina TaxID=576137 RepID=A0A1L7WCQ8_9HELO|nr:uncharacterized protein PAC_00342 [Phialocephala subalpina]
MIPKIPVPWITDAAIISKMLSPPSVPVVREGFLTPIHDNGQIVDIKTPIVPIEPTFYNQDVVTSTQLHDQWRNVRMSAYRTTVEKWEAQLEVFERYQAYVDSLDVSPLTVSPPPFPTPSPAPDMIITHGRGSDFDTPPLVGFNLGWARTQSDLCFSSDKKAKETETANHCAATFRSLESIYGAPTLGGRSFGALAAANASCNNDNVKKLICYTVTITRGLDELLPEPLLVLRPEIYVLFIVGDADERCPEIILHPLRKKMKARSWSMKVEEGDHALLFSPEQKRLDITEVIGQISAEWNRVEHKRDLERTEVVVGWKGDNFTGRSQWMEWMALEDGELIKKR